MHQRAMLEAQRASMAVELSTQQQDDMSRTPWQSKIRAITKFITSDGVGGVALQASLMDSSASGPPRDLSSLPSALPPWPCG